MPSIDKTWMKLRRDNPRYVEGVDAFLNFAEFSLPRDRMPCPCMKCANRYFENRMVVRTHLIVFGIRPDYNFWYCHGEKRSVGEVIVNRNDEDEDEDEDDDGSDDDDGADVDADGDDEIDHNNNDDGTDVDADGEDNLVDQCDDQYMEDIINDLYPNIEASSSTSDHPCDNAKEFYRLLDDSKQPLYVGSQISKASALLKLLHIKNVGQWTNTSFDLLLKLLKEDILPVNSSLPKSYYECKKFITDIGLTYEKIDACNNNCMLFRKENKDLQNCKVCGLSRWRFNESTGAIRKKRNGKTIPSKVLRYFPLTPRIQRLYMSSKIAPLMRWHKDSRIDDDVLRHPADSMTWKSFDKDHNEFSIEPRNLRLGLASDGFQPFVNGKTSYSIWPVVLIPYNVPPTLCMDSSNFILSLLIPGPQSPGDSIDIFLQPLIEELRELWDVGVRTFDASSSQYFNLRAALLWTINDFPAYANLSGWSTKGKFACPCCNKETESLRLTHWHKQCYMCHRRFLPPNHKFRKERETFNGRTEHRVAPKLLSGREVYLQCRDLRGAVLSKNKSKRTKISHESRGDNWTKLSIFFELPYWKRLLLRHNLDVMHIEKNICDSIVGTIMDVKEKTKDGIKARRDLQALNIRHSLHPIEVEGVLVCPPASYTLSSLQKRKVCQFLKDIKMPDGFCSNLAPCVNVEEKKIRGLKSHDCHIILEYLLPLATRGLFPDDVYDALVNLSNFFRSLCSKSLKLTELDKLQSQIALTLCKLEKIFPPSFFDIMVHLPVHLTFEALLGGPVQYRWMYPIEQYMGTLKKFIRNRNFVEGSISESYLVNESISLCAKYLEEQRPSTDTLMSDSTLSVFLNPDELSTGTVYTYELGDRERAHSYILKNCPETESFYSDYMEVCNELQSQSHSSEEHDRCYVRYFKNKVCLLTDDSERTKQLKILGSGPTPYVKRFVSCRINGYKFNTERHDLGLTTQNSGVFVLGANESDTLSYYGVLQDIIEVQYFEGNRVILFKCKWFDVHSADRGIKIDKHGFVSINVNRILKTQTYEPFILASQAKQVFYAPDMASRPGWKIVTKINPRYTSI